MLNIGVLALQGGVAEHKAILRSLGCTPREIRTADQLEGISALLLPGGESTTMISLLNRWGLTDKIREMGSSGFPIMGTCAGAILLSREIRERERSIRQEGLALADVRAVRNHFGRQRSSFVEKLAVSYLPEDFKGIFIRAPLLQPLSNELEVLARVQDGPVLLRQDNLWLASFHPELTSDGRIHRLFLQKTGVLKGSM